LVRLRAALVTEPDPKEARRLRSEARRSASQRNRCESVLAAMAREHAEATRRPPSPAEILAAAGARRG
jgi:hypothetical protein